MQSIVKFVTKDAYSPFNNLLFSLLQFRIIRWLKGIGHPAGSEGICVEQSLYDSERNDPLIRARLLLLALSDSNMLPPDPNERLQVCCNVATVPAVIHLSHR